MEIIRGLDFSNLHKFGGGADSELKSEEKIENSLINSLQLERGKHMVVNHEGIYLKLSEILIPFNGGLSRGSSHD